jgi:hypothetical protein
MCDCQRKLHDLLLIELKEKFPGGQLHRVTLQGYGVGVTFNLAGKSLGIMPVEMRVEVPTRKNPKETRTQKINHHLIFSYCPFCGEKYEVDPNPIAFITDSDNVASKNARRVT